MRPSNRPSRADVDAHIQKHIALSSKIVRRTDTEQSELAATEMWLYQHNLQRYAHGGPRPAERLRRDGVPVKVWDYQQEKYVPEDELREAPGPVS
jgi:hypothetical protein